MKQDSSYRVGITIDSTGDITGAGCGCPAGAQANSSYKHISVLCYGFGKVRKLRESDLARHDCRSGTNHVRTVYSRSQVR